MANQLAKRISIASAMMTIALVAINCALVREVSWVNLAVPMIWSALGIIDFVVLWKVILRRPLRAMHYTFLIVFVIAFLVLVNLAARELIHPTGPFIRLYQQVSNDSGRNVLLMEVASLGDFWLAAGMSLVLAWTVGLLAGWLERRRGWDIAAFFRGLLVGFGIANLFAVLSHAALGQPAQASAAFYANLVVLAICMIGGGVWGLSRLKSTPLDDDDTERRGISV